MASKKEAPVSSNAASQAHSSLAQDSMEYEMRLANIVDLLEE